MNTKRTITIILFLMAAFPGLCLARSDSVFYRNEKCVCWADPTTLEHVGDTVYEIWVTVELSDDSPSPIIIEHVDMERYAYSRQRTFIWDGPNQVDLPMDDAGIWYAIQPGSMDEALYDFIYANLRRRGKL
jgi:hypothetical protein